MYVYESTWLPHTTVCECKRCGHAEIFQTTTETQRSTALSVFRLGHGPVHHGPGTERAKHFRNLIAELDIAFGMVAR